MKERKADRRGDQWKAEPSSPRRSEETALLSPGGPGSFLEEGSLPADYRMSSCLVQTSKDDFLIHKTGQNSAARLFVHIIKVSTSPKNKLGKHSTG